MKPERMAGLVVRWVRLYTRDLPTAVARRRIEEIEADLHDHIAHERAQGTGERRIALSILSRAVRGLAADASWRGRHARTNAAYRAVVRIVLAVGFILLLPLVAMQFTDQVAWGPADFVVAGVLLAGTGLAFETVARRANLTSYRVAVAVALGASLFLVWAILAVGVIGTEGDPADLMYLGVLAVGVAGASIARFRPRGMAHAMLAMALAQAAVAAIALLAGKHQAPISSVTEVVGLNAFFAALYLGAAGLFRHAARKRPLGEE